MAMSRRRKAGGRLAEDDDQGPVCCPPTTRAWTKAKRQGWAPTRHFISVLERVLLSCTQLQLEITTERRATPTLFIPLAGLPSS